MNQPKLNLLSDLLIEVLRKVIGGKLVSILLKLKKADHLICLFG